MERSPLLWVMKVLLEAQHSIAEQACGEFKPQDFNPMMRDMT